MLPIDEHAKSGGVVYVQFAGSPHYEPCRFSGSYWRREQDDLPLDADAETYLPASWVEHAGAMREALIHADAQAAAASEIANVIYDSDVVDEALAATEWPKEG